MYVLCVLELSWMREGNGGDVEGEEGGGETYSPRVYCEERHCVMNLSIRVVD